MICKDCIYRAMCYKHEHYGYGEEYEEKPCEMFKNKADVVEVVRCGNCKNYNNHRYCNYFADTVFDDDFCSYGDRK